MARLKLHLTLFSISILAVMFAGRLPAHSDSTRSTQPEKVFDSTYRSHSASHKVIVDARDTELRDAILAQGGSVIEEYGAFSLMRAPQSASEAVGVQSRGSSAVRDDMNVITLRAHPFDTTELDGEDEAASSLGGTESADQQLFLVQMIGPIKKAWIKQLAAQAQIIAYIPNNAYLVRARSEQLPALRAMAAEGRNFVQFAGPYKPEYKFAPELETASTSSDRTASVTVQLVATDDSQNDLSDITAMSAGVIEPASTAQSYTNVRLRVSPDRLADIARKSTVVWIEPWSAPVPLDEKQGMIIAGLYSGNTVNAPNYLAWLGSRGITDSPDFSIDFAGTGFDKGTLDPADMHKDFLGAGGASRVVYLRYVAGGGLIGTDNDTSGHGTINASIAGGANDQAGPPYTDADGYHLGLGIHPFAKIGVSKIFDPDYLNPSFTQLVDQMYGLGARVSNNSWGTYTNSYTVDSQSYDRMVRDARAGDADNQELTIVFSSGNKGAGGLTSPGNAKNTIVVGASENLRPGVDGCQIGPDGADNINDIADFSSGGPTTDGRIKPDLVAPGTHIQGARSQDRAFTAGGVCGPGNYPTDQFLYTWSSGTSHAAPAVSGAAALLRQFFQKSTGKVPSPAMQKAYMANSATYLTGNRAGDNLPSPVQGHGLVNVGRMLDEVPRMMVDEDQVLTNTGQTYTLTGHVVDPSKPFRVSLAWTDAPGSPAGNPVVNNLDLQVDVGGKTYLGNNFSGGVSIDGGAADVHNNLEGVYTVGASGQFTIRVVASNIAGDGVPGNSDTTDQDFALVVYNAASGTGGGGGGGGGGAVDSPPTVKITYPVGGEKITVGSFLRIFWDASDDKGIQSQSIEFSADGTNFSPIGAVSGSVRQFDWLVPAIPTPLARIRVTALDGVNLPVSSTSPQPFEILVGPPDTVPPTVQVTAPTKNSTVGGGQVFTIQWKEADNQGVIQRLIELSTDNGNTWSRVASVGGPSSGQNQTYSWVIPVDLSTQKAKIRVTVFDGAGNSASSVGTGNFDVWPLPIITNVVYHEEGTPQFIEVSGRYFRNDVTQIYADGVLLKRVYFLDKYFDGQGMSHKIFSKDKKISKRIPIKEDVDITVKLPDTGQVSPAFTYRRPRPQ